MYEYEKKPYRLNLPTFDGYESKFQIWWKTFQAYARVKIFEVGLETQVNMPMSDAAYRVLLGVDEPQEAQKKRIKAGRANEAMLSKLTMSFETASLINMNNDCTTTDRPNYKIEE